jgi:hypothetical protein
MRSKFSIALLVLVCCTTLSAQNLLTNPSFTNPAIPDAAPGNCPGTDTVPNASFPGWNDVVGTVDRNGTYAGPECLDGAYAGRSSSSDGAWYLYQTVSNLPSEQGDYLFSGLWMRYQAHGDATYRIQIREGTSPTAGTVIAEFSETKSGAYAHPDFAWLPFAVQGTKQAGVTDLTVVVKNEKPNIIWGWSMYVDECALAEATCDPLPSITSVSPDWGARGSVANLTITGQGFINGLTEVSLQGGGTTVESTDEVVTDGGQTVTASLDLTGVAGGNYTLIVSVNPPSCPTVSTDFLVVLEAFSNGSFESPVVGACTPDTTNPADWRVSETGEWGFTDAVNLSGGFSEATIPNLPTCPPKDGDQYGTTVTNRSSTSSHSEVYQTFQVTQNSNYTFSGWFASSGQVNVNMAILEGGLAGTVVADEDVILGQATSDWSYFLVTAPVTTPYATVVWKNNVSTAGYSSPADGDFISASHADALMVEECANPNAITLNTVTPVEAVNDQPVTLTIGGSGFDGSESVMLVDDEGKLTLASSVVHDSQAGTLDATIDISAGPTRTGSHDLIVKQGGCVKTFTDAILIVGDQFRNGDFDLPDVGDTDPCDLQRIAGYPDAWYAELDDQSGLVRNGEAPPPTVCPSPNGGNFGSLTGSGTGMRAKQTIAVVPGWEYRFGGYFAAYGGSVGIELWDGDSKLTEINSQFVTSGWSSDWVYGEVTGSAASSVMTVVVSFYEGTQAGGAHFDGLIFEPTITCNDPFADADGDGDVDQVDFAVFQKCFTGSNYAGELPDECKCFDRIDNQGLIDGSIDQFDWGKFEACASGPDVPANPACDD